MDFIATHMYVWSTEADAEGGPRREVDLTPRHSAGFDWLVELEGNVRVGVEVFYTGRQQSHESPYRQRTAPYFMWGAIAEWRVGRARIFVNAENLGDERQTKFDPLILPSRRADGRWTDDIWAPLDGRTVNAGVRFRF
jgi:iron complex outermembrane receptor protein